MFMVKKIRRWFRSTHDVRQDYTFPEFSPNDLLTGDTRQQTLPLVTRTTGSGAIWGPISSYSSGRPQSIDRNQKQAAPPCGSAHPTSPTLQSNVYIKNVQRHTQLENDRVKQTSEDQKGDVVTKSIPGEGNSPLELKIYKRKEPNLLDATEKEPIGRLRPKSRQRLDAEKKNQQHRSEPNLVSIQQITRTLSQTSVATIGPISSKLSLSKQQLSLNNGNFLQVTCPRNECAHRFTLGSLILVGNALTATCPLCGHSFSPGSVSQRNGSIGLDSIGPDSAFDSSPTLWKPAHSAHSASAPHIHHLEVRNSTVVIGDNTVTNVYGSSLTSHLQQSEYAGNLHTNTTVPNDQPIGAEFDQHDEAIIYIDDDESF